MPGLLGVAGRQSRDAAVRVIRGCDRLLRGRCAAEHWIAHDGQLAVCRVRLDTHAASPPAGPQDLRVPIVLFQGVLHNELALTEQAAREPWAGERRSHRSSSPPLDEVLSRLYRRDGDEFVANLEGEFALLVLDPARHRLLAATDASGNYPVYWHAEASGLIVGTDLGAVLASRSDPAQLCLRAVADYLTCGMVLGDKTLARDVRALGPGELLTYDLDQRGPRLRRYCDLAGFFEPKATNKQEYLDSVVHAFGGAVSRALHGKGQVGLSLSGGLDSRAILSAAGARASSLGTFTVGVRGCADEIIGGRLARIAGTRHTFFPLDAGYLRDFLPNMAEMVSLTGGMYLSHGLTEMLALRVLDQAGISVLLRGHGGELAKAHLAWPLHTDRHVYTLRSADELAGYLAGRANYVTPGLPLSRVLTPDATAAAGDGARESFRELLRDTTLSPPDACSYLYLHELHRRFTVPSLELFRSKVEVRLPFVDRAFLKVVLAAPPEWRDSTDIHQRITAAGIPALGRVRDSNTGAPANAGPRAIFVLDKLNSVLRQLNVPGYRHYHNFDGWMRRTLLDSVEAELLSPTARVQAFVPAARIRAIVTDTRTGVADRSHLLQILLILELWQREHHIEAAA